MYIAFLKLSSPCSASQIFIREANIWNLPCIFHLIFKNVRTYCITQSSKKSYKFFIFITHFFLICKNINTKLNKYMHVSLITLRTLRHYFYVLYLRKFMLLRELGGMLQCFYNMLFAK